MNDIQRKNVATIEEACRNAFALNFEALKPLIAEDFVIHEAEGLPFGGTFRGIEGYVRCMTGIEAFFADKTLAPPDYVPVGDERMLMMSTLDGYIASNRRHVNMPTISVWDFTDGKISRVQPFFYDTKKIADLAAL